MFFIRQFAMLLALSLPLVSSFGLAARAASCDEVFYSNLSEKPGEKPLVGNVVYIAKFDTGAGFSRVVRGRVDVVEFDSLGAAIRFEIFHDRGRGVYLASNVYHSIEPSWARVASRMGPVPVLLVASAADGARFVGREEGGELKVYSRDLLVFPHPSGH